ncbi:MAG TPA: protein-methionine-sulfoxide reductase catalytic subunit MsrP [Anaerolineales bacterium]|nr:protein-methionine-sulfoxide reductase catalytic subunit MsrP [Anaerolineales bacterium]
MINIPKIPSSDITPEHVYLSRREFIKSLGVIAGSMALTACGASPASNAAATPDPSIQASTNTDELGDALTPYEAVTNYNNYYEFSVDKEEVAGLAKDFPVSPWEVQVGGLVRNPKTYTMEDLLQFEQEERIYRLRCVEAWSMVIPWVGFPMSKLLAEIEPTSDAKFVRFESIYAPDQMPGQSSSWYNWPYVEGLRLDEAMNDLAIFATGLYGKPLPPQDGAPIRVVAPWKYGFKSIKAIVKIDLVDTRPTSLWMAAAPREYGFYANVNPEVDHPRWSQATERRIGELSRRPTLKFNGYQEQVGYLYDGMGMDLTANY